PHAFPYVLIILNRLQSLRESRRRLYSYYAERAIKSEINAPLLQLSLTAEDWEWLEHRAPGAFSKLPGVWSHVFVLATAARAEGQVDESQWSRLLAEMESQAPGLVSEINAQRDRLEEQMRQWARSSEDNSIQEPESLPLSEVVRDILRKDVHSADDRMR